MDVDAEEAARAQTAKKEMLMVMGGQASTAPPNPNASGEPEKETDADDENRRKWPKPSAKGGKGAQQGGWHGGDRSVSGSPIGTAPLPSSSPSWTKPHRT